MLITSRTPLRVSFFGGGTDYPEYYRLFPGAVVGMTINKYVYVSALKLATYIHYKYRLSYSILETAGEIAQIKHPVVRSVLAHHKIEEALDISIMADMPASSGLGSSSAFTVGLLNLIGTLKGTSNTKLDLGRAAIHVERELLKERVGVQDQLHAAFGGINRFDFIDDRIRISPVQMSGECQNHLTNSLILVFTGVQRYASETLKEQIKATEERKVDKELRHLIELVAQGVAILEGTDPDAMLNDFGAMMHEGWMTKRKLSGSVSSPAIDDLYDKSLKAGALGGKLCGAGGGGFLLMVVPPERQPAFNAAMSGHSLTPIGLDTQGSVILTG